MQKHNGTRGRRWVTVAPLLAALAVASLASCGEADGGDDVSDETTAAGAAGGVEGRTFVSTGLRKAGEEAQLAAGSVIRLAFEGERLVASGGCNTMSGAAHVEDGVLHVDGPLAGTQMACEKALMDQDAWLAELLESQPSVTLEGTTMTMTSGDAATGTVLTFTDRQVAEPDVPLEGTSWRLDSMSVSGATSTAGTSAPDTAVSSVPAGVTSTMSINDGRLSANAGCNRGSASVTVAETSMTVGPMALTRRMCGKDAMAVESAVVKVLTGAVTYSIEADRLTVSGPGGMLGYRADASKSPGTPSGAQPTAP